MRDGIHGVNIAVAKLIKESGAGYAAVLSVVYPRQLQRSARRHFQRRGAAPALSTNASHGPASWGLGLLTLMRRFGDKRSDGWGHLAWAPSRVRGRRECFWSDDIALPSSQQRVFCSQRHGNNFRHRPTSNWPSNTGIAWAP